MTGKRLILMRHAKSSWKSEATTDHARPLNKRGRRDAPRIAAELARRGWVPDHVTSSDSERTVETFARMREPLGFGGVLQLDSDLYHGDVDDVRQALRRLPATARTALLLGHNPGFEQALDWLASADAPMKTGCAALLRTARSTFEEAVRAPGSWQLDTILFPRDLASTAVG